MTFTEMIARMEKNADMSYDEVLRMLPDTMQTQAARSNAYRSFTARLYVTDEYQPYLDFYCATSEGGHFFNINSIYSIQLVRSYNGISKQFWGEVNAWLRSSNSIEYYVNGDFFNNGTTDNNCVWRYWSERRFECEVLCNVLGLVFIEPL